MRQQTVLLRNADAHWHKVFACWKRWLYVLALREDFDSKIAKTQSIGGNKMRKLRVQEGGGGHLLGGRKGLLRGHPAFAAWRSEKGKSVLVTARRATQQCQWTACRHALQVPVHHCAASRTVNASHVTCLVQPAISCIGGADGTAPCAGTPAWGFAAMRKRVVASTCEDALEIAEADASAPGSKAACSTTRRARALVHPHNHDSIGIVPC